MLRRKPSGSTSLNGKAGDTRTEILTIELGFSSRGYRTPTLVAARHGLVSTGARRRYPCYPPAKRCVRRLNRSAPQVLHHITPMGFEGINCGSIVVIAWERYSRVSPAGNVDDDLALRLPILDQRMRVADRAQVEAARIHAWYQLPRLGQSGGFAHDLAVTGLSFASE